jgi:hypothetical protein
MNLKKSGRTGDEPEGPSSLSRCYESGSPMHQTLFRKADRQVRVFRTFHCRNWNNEEAKPWNFFDESFLKALRQAHKSFVAPSPVGGSLACPELVEGGWGPAAGDVWRCRFDGRWPSP